MKAVGCGLCRKGCLLLAGCLIWYGNGTMGLMVSCDRFGVLIFVFEIELWRWVENLGGLRLNDCESGEVFCNLLVVNSLNWC